MSTRRARLVCLYGAYGIRFDIVWDIVTTKLLPVIETLEPLIPPPEDG